MSHKLEPFLRLREIIATLRAPGGCAWDRKQTHKTLLPYLIEETYEVLEAIESEDFELLKEELGDLLCQIVFHGQLAEESEKFYLDDSIESINEKLIRRHPHVFGDKKELDPQQVRDQWERRKFESGEKKSVVGGIPRSAPALVKGFRLGEKAGGVGFDWENAGDILDKIKEEIGEIEEEIARQDKDALEGEIGDLLFAVSSLSRKLEINPEQALNKTLDKFVERFKYIEKRVKESGKGFDEFSLEELERWWQEAKISQ